MSNVGGILVFLFLFKGLVLSPQEAPSKEHQIEAVFLFNFAQFVEWPVNTLPHAEAPIIIGVLGHNIFGTYLNDVVANEKVKDHPIMVKYFETVEEIDECHILFINYDDTRQWDEIIPRLKGRSILTVCDAKRDVKKRSMVRFFTKDDKIRFQIESEAAKSAGLTISSKLLRLAENYTVN